MCCGHVLGSLIAFHAMRLLEGIDISLGLQLPPLDTMVPVPRTYDSLYQIIVVGLAKLCGHKLRSRIRSLASLVLEVMYLRCRLSFQQLLFDLEILDLRHALSLQLLLCSLMPLLCGRRLGTLGPSGQALYLECYIALLQLVIRHALCSLVTHFALFVLEVLKLRLGLVVGLLEIRLRFQGRAFALLLHHLPKVFLFGFLRPCNEAYAFHLFLAL